MNAVKTDSLPHSDSGIVIRRITGESPWRWLALAWRQIWRAPAITLGYGAAFAVASAGLAALLVWLEAFPLILPLAGGFLLLGPMLAVGLYETARRLVEGEAVTLRAAILVRTAAPTQLAFMGVVLLLIYFAWIRLAMLLFALVNGINASIPPFEEFLTSLFFTWDGIILLVSGSIVGGILAFIIFAITAISIPLMMRRDVDAVTAALARVEAIRKNPGPMILWAWLILLLTAFGVATAFVGLVVTFPLVGMATWHAYRELVEPARGNGT